MKKIFLLTAFFFLTAGLLSAQNKGKTTTPKKTTTTKTTAKMAPTSMLKPGTKLIYTLNYNNTVCTFQVEVKSIYPDVQYIWEISPPISTRGKIKITQSALDNALVMNNDFNLDNTLMTDETALWVSKKVYNALKNKQPVNITTGKGSQILSFISTESKTYKINNEMKALTVINGKTDKSVNFTVLDDPNPVILRQTLRFNIELKEMIIP